MFNPRADFTSLLHYGIKLQNIFDIQVYVLCMSKFRQYQVSNVQACLLMETMLGKRNTPYVNQQIVNTKIL